VVGQAHTSSPSTPIIYRAPIVLSRVMLPNQNPNPPGEVDLSIVLDSQPPPFPTLTRPRQSSGKTPTPNPDTRFAPYTVPRPQTIRRTRSASPEAPSYAFSIGSVSSGSSVADDAEHVLDGVEDLTPKSRTEALALVHNINEFRSEADRITETVVQNQDFLDHALNISEGAKEELFPNNDVYQQGSGQSRPTISHTPSFTPIAPPETRSSLPRSWTRELCASINIQNEKIEALTKLLIHSVAQNNAYASLNGVITDKMEQRLRSMEKTISAISQRQDGPSTDAPARHNVDKDLLNNIARKVTSIEHNTRNPTMTDGNPPVVPKTVQVPQVITKPVQSTTNTKPANWVPSLVNESSFGILAGWAAMITQGRWGSRTKEGKLEGVNFLNLNAKSRGGVAEFIKRSARFHFSRNGSGSFILPPHTPLTFKLGWSSSITWTVVDTNKVTKNTRRNTIFAENTSTSDKVHVSLGATNNTDVPPIAANTPPVDPSHSAPTSSPEVFYDDLWTPTPPSGKTKSFAEAAKKPTTNASKGKNPQTLYNGVPVSQFMQRAEKKTNGY